MELDGEAARLAEAAGGVYEADGTCGAGRFCALLAEVEPLLARAERKRLNRRERQRGIAAGNAYDLHLCDRLLMTLIYYRTYVPQEFLGYLFDLDAGNARRSMARLRPVLAPVFRIPKRRTKANPGDIATLFLTGRNSASTGRKAA
jgi:hypothetical protein